MLLPSTGRRSRRSKSGLNKTVRELTDDEDLKREGNIDKASGEVEDAVENEKVADEAREAVRKD